MTVFFLRHQAAGIVHDHPFASRPTDAQIAPLRSLLEWRHGAAHPRTGQAYWMDVVAIEVHEDGAIPVVDIPAGAPGPRGRASAVGVGGFADLSAHGNGFVRNPRVEV